MSQDKPATASYGEAGDELTRLRLQTRSHEIDRLIDQDRVLPVFKDEVLAFAATLDDQETVSFSEGAPASTRKDWFMSYLARQPQVISFGEMDLGQDPISHGAGRPRHNIPDGYQVDRQNDDMFFAAQRLAKEKGISFADAVDLVIEGRG
ncbi:hypothetical protein [Pseudorhodobacter sp.]|uniref:hypothetical protein n=1 Tax=Pseudorhodobacter sp. TaxID=1934400 RepID=UPI002647A38E|nr:hypothetical protein [Pseudorhodobacter sp.]MDN5788510.1 hypothetical protein [Pseudorhodobacter sp.]